MREKLPCPVCGKPLKPTGKSGYAPNHNHKETGARCRGSMGGLIPRCPECGYLECANFPAPAETSEAPPAEIANPTEPAVWEYLFQAVRSEEEMTTMWLRAKEAGISGIALNELMALARQALTGVGTVDAVQ